MGAKENKVQNAEKILINHFATTLMANKGYHKNKTHKNNVECFFWQVHITLIKICISRPCPIKNKSFQEKETDHSIPALVSLSFLAQKPLLFLKGFSSQAI